MSEKPQPVAYTRETLISAMSIELEKKLGAAVPALVWATRIYDTSVSDALSLARNEALEEAAKVADDKADWCLEAFGYVDNSTKKAELRYSEKSFREYAAAIRARKTP